MEKQLFQTREFMLIHCYQIKKKSVVICNNSLKAKVVTFCHKRGPETCLELKKKYPNYFYFSKYLESLPNSFGGWFLIYIVKSTFHITYT